jgi:succinate dehydrogenase / fumarate reductase flavoprotein subunit
VIADASNTTVPGLYAAGECACVSVHGANRLGTNSLLDINVFGRRAGLGMAEEAERLSFAPLPDDAHRDVERLLSDLSERTRLETIGNLRGELQQSMDDNCSVYRTEDTLRAQTAKIAELQERFQRAGIQDKSKAYNTDLLEAVELGFLLDIAQVMVAGARARQESRGGHYRGDFEARDDVNWMKHSLAWKINGDTKLDYKPVTVTRYQPTERKY